MNNVGAHLGRVLAIVVAGLISGPAAAFTWYSWGSTESLSVTTAYGLPTGGDLTSATRARVECTVPVHDVVDELCVFAPTTILVDTHVATLMKGSSATSLAVTLQSGTQSACDTDTSGVDYAAQTDEMSVEFSATGVATITRLLYRIRHNTQFSTSWLCGSAGDSALSAASTFYWSFAGIHELSDTVEYNSETLIAEGGTWKNLCMHMDTEPGASNTMTYTVDLDGSPQSLVVALSGTGASAIDGCDTNSAHSFTGNAASSISLSSAPTGGTPADTFGTWSIALDAKNRAHYNAPVAIRDTANAAATDYMEVWGAESDYNAVESRNQQAMGPIARFDHLYTEIAVFGTACSTWTTTLRVSGAAELSTTHNAANVQHDTTDPVVAESDDLLSYSIVGGLCGPGTTPNIHATLGVMGRQRRIW